MPELPDVEIYVERLNALVGGQPLEKIRLASPFVVRTFDPRITEANGKIVHEVTRLGKRMIFALEDDLFMVVHLMVAGRFRWKKRGVSIKGKGVLGAFDFPDGSIRFTEASKQKRASIHLVRGRSALLPFDRGGLEVVGASREQFVEVLKRERHTIKRTLTDPRFYSGIGNAYSDEILHRAQISPVKMSTSLDDDQIDRLHTATLDILTLFTDRIREEIGDKFPDKVTAFRDDFAVHGKYKVPCPVCETPVQRIIRGEHETNYCPTCQTGGKLLADRALSRLLKKDWPKTLEELDERLGR